MKVPDYVVENIMIEANRALRGIYDKYIRDHTGINFESFCIAEVNSVLASLEHLVEVNKDTLDPVINKRWKTKRRWLDRELRVDSLFYKEVEVIAKGLYEQFKDNLQKFKAVYDCDTYSELKDHKIQQLNNWASSSDVPICDFLYLRGKQPFQIEKAMNNDIEWIALRIIKEQCPLGMQSAIVALPHSMSNIPIDFTNRVRISDQQIIVKGHEQFYVNKYYVDDETFLESLMNIEFLKTGIMNAVFKTLNATDINIFLYIMSLRDENFYITREVVVDIGDVVRNVFSSDGQKNYIAVKESLYRMQFLNSGAIDASLRGFTVKIFDNVDIYKANDEKEMAKIIVNIDIVNEYIKNQTINMYRDIIDKFTLDSAKVAIFPLQRERIRCSTSTRDDEPLVFQTNVNFFRGILYFSNKRKKENIRIIERTLEEIIENQITIKGYERKGDVFLLEFFPISTQERRDLLNYKDPLLELSYEQTSLDLTPSD